MADYISNYTGAEIDDAVGKASTIPQFTQSDANKVLTVNSTGNGFKYTTPASGGGDGVDLSDLNTLYSSDTLSRSFLIKYTNGATYEDEIGWTNGFAPTGGSGEFGKFLMIWNSQGDDSNLDYYTILEDFYSSSVSPNAPLLIKEESYGNEVTRKIDYGTPEMFVPDVTASDNGKVLTVVSHTDEYDNTNYIPSWETPNGLPVFDTRDANKMLAVTSCYNSELGEYECSAEWVSVGEFVPSVNGACGDYVVLKHGGSDTAYLEDTTSTILDRLENSWAGSNHTSNIGKFLAVVPCGEMEDGHYHNSSLAWQTITISGGVPAYDQALNRETLVVSTCGGDPHLLWDYVIPPCGDSELGNFLTVEYVGGFDSYAPQWTSGQLAPLSVQADVGKVLAVVSHTDQYDDTSYIPSWVNIFPNYSVSDIGKTLQVISDGNGGCELAWV